MSRRRLIARAVLVGTSLAGCGRGGLLLVDVEDDDAGEGEMAPLEPDGDPIGHGCPAVDYLFVIDDSASMADNQAKLAKNFGTFVAGVERSLDAVPSLHVGVVATDLYSFNTPECRTIGGLVVRTGGPSSSESSCGPYEEGRSFMTGADDLDEAFACAAAVGTAGSPDEEPLSAIGHAVGPRLHADGMCNEGFVRDDALLVVVVLTDEDEKYGAPFASRALEEAKLGFRDNVVFVAIVAEANTEVAALAATFEYGFVGDLDDGDYGPIFEQAVDVVVAACEEDL